MIKLPIKAFLIPGYDEYIELTIDEVFDFPYRTSCWGGYDVSGKIEIVASNYRVSSSAYFTTGELYYFKENLWKCYKSLSVEAVFKNAERDLEILATFKHTGRVTISGSYQERPDINNKLIFEITCDQTCILSAIKDLEVVEKLFGNNVGLQR